MSSLTAAVSSSLNEVAYPASRSRILSAVNGKKVEGWELSFFLDQALGRRTYNDLRDVMKDLEAWLEVQG
ncbi:MAG: hypothetical protein LYZ69_02810 [Nitrososphaerales archaeon]|nr:hypothetical protein [Nitrososphaerales archaeon]